MASFKNMKDLAKYINEQAQASLEKDVSRKVIEVEQKHIQSDVYDVYTPFS